MIQANPTRVALVAKPERQNGSTTAHRRASENPRLGERDRENKSGHCRKYGSTSFLRLVVKGGASVRDPVYRATLLLILIRLPGAFGQVTTGSVSGFVLDPARRPIHNAAVTLADSGRSISRHATTDTTGFYRFIETQPAAYSVSASAENFAEVKSELLYVRVDMPMRLDFVLPIAGVQQSVAVAARPTRIQTESPELSVVLDRDKIEHLPLNRRDFLQLALLAPGVLPPVEDSELSTRGSFAMHVNGGREEFNNFLLDGVDNNDQDTNRYVLQPPVDAIQEFKIATNAYSAEYGRNAGGQVNVVTRSGTNDWSGFAYDYLRNRALDARNFFDGKDKPQLIRNQFGLGLAGPAIKNRTFFFGDFDGLRDRQSLSRLATVPTEAERQGDLSALNRSVMDPLTGLPFPNNRIPGARIAVLAPRVLELYPSPNRSGQTGNYLAQPVLKDSQSQFNGRLDHQLGPQDQVTLRYSYGNKDLFEPYAEQSTGVPGFGDFLKDTGQNALVHYQAILSPQKVNSLLLGFNRAGRRLLPENYQVDVNHLWGVEWLPKRAFEFGFPSISVADFSLVGDVTQLPIDRFSTTYQLADTFSLIHRNHGVKLGVEIRHLQLNGIVDVYPRGSISFLGDLTGAGLGDLLLGLPTFGIQAQADNRQTLRTTSINGFVQDDWKARSNLTLNLGVRYEYNAPPTDPTNRMSVFDLKTGRLSQVGTNGIPRSGIKPDWNNLAPRVGFAWTPAPRLVIRAGYGLYYDAGILVTNSALYFNPPYFNVNVFFPSANSLLTLANPFPRSAAFTPPPSLSTLSPDLTTSYVQHWSFGLQHEMSASGVISLEYAASKGTHLIRSRDLNQPPPGPGDVASRVPNPAFGNIFFTETGANSEFQSLQASYSRSMARGLSAWVAYTLSKSIDDTSAFLSTKADKNFPQDSHNYRAERALSSFDVHQRGTAAVVYEFSGRRWWIRNTEFRSIITAQTGQPFTPILLNDNSNTGNTGGSFGSDRPDLLHKPSLSRRSPEEWFDTSAFAVPPRYTFGSAGRNIVRGPGLSIVDASIVRRFPIRERSWILMEAQVFNLMNRANFDLPERYADEPDTFGKIFSAKASRQIQIALRFQF